MEAQTQVYHIDDKVYQKPLRLINTVLDVPKRFESCSFNNFEVNELNRKAFKGCIQISPGDCITLTGAVGTGKTHLAVATIKNFPMLKLENEAAEKQKLEYQYKVSIDYEGYAPGGEIITSEHYKQLLDYELWKYRKAVCKFISAPELFLQLSEAFGNEKSKTKILDDLMRYDCVLIDDLGTEKVNETNRQNFYLVIDRFYREMKSLILTTNLTIDEINIYEPRIASRLSEMGKIYFIDGKDHRVQ